MPLMTETHDNEQLQQQITRILLILFKGPSVRCARSGRGYQLGERNLLTEVNKQYINFNATEIEVTMATTYVVTSSEASLIC